MYNESFKKSGYVLIKNVIHSEKINAALSEIKKIESQFNPANPNYFYENSLIDPSQKLLRRIEKAADVQPIGDLLRSKEVLRILREVTKNEQILFKDKVNCKLPGGQGFRPHVDGHFFWIDESGKRRKGWSEYGSDFISVVIPLEPSTIENGTLEVSTKDLTMQHLGNSWDTIANRLIEENGYIRPEDLSSFPMSPVEMFPGDILIFDWLNVHGSQKNTSQKPRRTIFATYLPTLYGDPREQYYTEKQYSQRSKAKKVLL